MIRGKGCTASQQEQKIKLYWVFVITCSIRGFECLCLCTGEDLRGTEVWRTVLPKNWGGDGPCICPPNISRSGRTVIGCEAKYELSKKWSQGGTLCSEIEVFGEEKGS